MNILIICSNRNKQPISVIPIGACIVAEAAEKSGHTVTLLDLMFVKDFQKKVDQTLTKTNPDIIGISLRNIDNNDMKNPQMFCKELLVLVNTIKKKSKALIILGGAAISIMPEQILRYTQTTIAVLGNGEIVFPKLLTNLEHNLELKEVPGIAWLENNIFKKNNLHMLESQSLNHFSYPDFSRWIDTKAYISMFSTVPIQSKRGCPFKCVYCTYSISEGNEYHLSNTETIVNSIKKLVSNNIRDIEFVDNVFNAPYTHAIEICKNIAHANLGARLQTIELNPKFIDDALLTAMEEAGFVAIGVTAESADDTVLKGLGKNYTFQDLKNAAEIVNRHKIPSFWIFLLGGPGESEKTVQQTLNFAKKYIRPSDTVFFNIGIRIYPGTELEQIARKEGVLKIPEKEMLNPVFYLSPQIDREWLSKTLYQTIKENINFIDSESFSLPTLPGIFKFAHSVGLKQPLWRYTRIIRRGLKLLGAYK